MASQQLIGKLTAHANARHALKSALRAEGKRIQAERQAAHAAAAAAQAQKGSSPSEPN